MSTTNFTFKLTVVGNGSVGKTSLINRFVNNKFENSYIETVGIDMFETDVILEDESSARLLIYDLGGQQYWSKLRSSFYQRARGCIMVYDVSKPETFTALEEWYKEVRENIGYEVPIVVIGNKTDLENKVSNKQIDELKSKFEFTFLQTSAKTGQMVNQAFETICFQIKNKFS